MTASWSSVELPAVRLALGLGDQELEHRLRPALDATDDLRVVAQCLSADQVLEAATAGQADGVVVAWTLHRLSDVALDALERTRVPLVLLVADVDDARWAARRAQIVPITADVHAVRTALTAARAGKPYMSARSRPADPIPQLKPADRLESETVSGGRVIAVTGGSGAPGRTTVAANLAVALGGVAPTVVVEADFAAPALAAYLGLDPTRNVCPLAHAVREDRHAWPSALADELQPLCAGQSKAVVLCGPPKCEMRSSVPPAFVHELIARLAQQYRYVIVDVGADVLGLDTVAACTRTALLAATDILFVTHCDLVGLWHARTSLAIMERHAGLDSSRLSIVLNQYDRRAHHGSSEIAHHLGAPVIGVIPADHGAIQRATAEQQALVLSSSGRAARAMLALAEHVHAGRLTLARETSDSPRRRWWNRVVPALGASRDAQARSRVNQGRLEGAGRRERAAT